MSDETLQNDLTTVPLVPANGEFSPQWGHSAPRGGVTVLNRAMKDGARVPLFFGQFFISSLRDLGYNSTTSALCEHVDNALQWGATEIRVYFHQSGKQPNQQIDVLVYDNGIGMAPHVLKVAMAFGGSMVFENRRGIGRYGMGLKAAALNVAQSVDVYSWQEPGTYYSMTLDVNAIGRDRNNMIELPEPQISDEMPTGVATILTKPMAYPTSTSNDDLLAQNEDDLKKILGRSGTIVFMPKCDRLTKSTARGLVDHAIKEMGRIYRKFIERGVRLYINNRQVDALDPTYWMMSARHTQIEGLTEARSALIDSWTIPVPLADNSDKKTEVRVRMYLLPVHNWAGLPRETLVKKLHVFDDHYVSYMRNGREVEIGAEPRLKLKKHHTNSWMRVEIEFNAEADEAFGVSANKQGVRLQQFAADAILKHDEGRFTKNVANIRKLIREKEFKAAAEKRAGQPSDAERQATETDSIQQVPLPLPPMDTPDQQAALLANLHGLAVSLRQEGETEEQAFSRVRESKYLLDFHHQDYAPFYDTEYKFGKLILRVNTAHPFHQKVWQPIADLAKKTIQIAESDEGGATSDVAEAARKALLGVQLMLMSLARTQAQMTAGEVSAEQIQFLRNLRTGWSTTLETQLFNV